MVQSLKIILLFILRAIKIKSSDSVALGVQIKVRRSSVLIFINWKFMIHNVWFMMQNQRSPNICFKTLSHRSLLWSMLFTLSAVSVRLFSATAEFQPRPMSLESVVSVIDPKTSENKTYLEKLDKRNRRYEAISWAYSRNAFFSVELFERDILSVTLQTP